MRLSLDPRARRLLRRIPHTSVYSAAELVLLSLLALQCARLVWTIVTPVDPVGDWRAQSALQAPVTASTEVLRSFDPFFRLSGDTGPVTVTSLNLKLFGVREDRASGRGSAIISTPDGQQRSYGVGEEIMPGVILTAVSFDSATLSRAGAAEQLFLDQSPPAQVVGSPVSAPAPSLAPPAPPANLAAEVRYEPRLAGGQVTGVTVQPQGSGTVFRAAGLEPGDVIVSVNGQRISSADQARAIATQLAAASEVSVQVERGGRTIPLRIRTRP